MDRRVRVRRMTNSPFTLVYSDPPPNIDLDKLAPNFSMNRIWMGAVPEESVRLPGEDRDRVYPAYACVVGELYIDTPQQRDMPRIVLDEAVGLNPAEFSEEECEKFGISEKEFDYPTIFSLRSAIIALKDIWWPSRLILPPDQGFYEAMLRTDGLLAYDSQVGEFEYQRWHPMFKARGRTIDQGIFMVEQENRAYNEGLINALMGPDLLEVYTDCTMLLPERRPNALRSVGLVLNQMQRMDEAPFRRYRTPVSLRPEGEEDDNLRDERNRLIEYRDTMEYLFGDRAGAPED